MKLSEIKSILASQAEIAFQLPSGELVPRHFHVTEVGKITKHFIDCGGKVRNQEVANFQLWSSDDYDHRLHPEKLVHIIELGEKVLELGDLEIEVEYQGSTIGKYGLDFQEGKFLLTTTQTDCLAREGCGLPEPEIEAVHAPAFDLSNMSANNSGSCTPGGGCC